jgi:hypothetical protein
LIAGATDVANRSHVLLSHGLWSVCLSSGCYTIDSGRTDSTRLVLIDWWIDLSIDWLIDWW